MIRTSKYKIMYTTLLGVLVVCALLITKASDGNPLVVLFIALLLLVPGRIQGHYWRDFFTGRQLVSDQKFEISIPVFLKFIDSLKEDPWKKKLIWASGGIYTHDVEAMAFSNIGVAYLHMGDLPRSEAAFNQALQIDNLCPLPYYNLAVLKELQSDREGAEMYLKKAASLGYKRTTIDSIIHEAGAALAFAEGKSEKEQTHSIAEPASEVNDSRVDTCEPFPASLNAELELPVEGNAYVLEMMNDDVTPMEYVVSILSGCLGKKRQQSLELMLDVHKSGAARILTGNEHVLNNVVKHLSQDAKEKNYPLQFRVSKI